ncbi:MAG: WD40 repeat domain-containing protein [Planctomycetes bacterium]|nr:WD40 repeat domain-containing protein [Planctomycetota bacterium]
MSRAFALAALLALVPAAPGQVKKVLNDFPDRVGCVAFSPDGKTLATVTHPSKGYKDALRLWDVATGKELCQLGIYKFACSAVVFSPDGRTLAVHSRILTECTIDLWDLATRKARRSIKTRRGTGTHLAISPDSKLLAGAGFGERGAIWDMQTGKELAVLGPKDFVDFDPPAPHFTCVVFSPDGKTLATSAFSGVLVLWDVPSGKRRADLVKHERTVDNVCFAPDGETLYSLGEDRLLVYWDVATGKERKSVDLRPQSVHRTSYSALSPDGRTLAVLAQGHLRLFDLKEKAFRPDVDWASQGGYQACMAFSPDGKLIATGSGGSPGSNTVYLWQVPPRKKPRD